jgi:hypothetical protein
MAVLSSVWRSKCRLQPSVRESLVTNVPNPSSYDVTTQAISDVQTPQSRKWNYNLVMTALASANNSDCQVKDIMLCNNSSNTDANNSYSRSSERMDLLLAFANAGDEVEKGFPTAVGVSVQGNDVELPSQDDIGTVGSLFGLLEQSSRAISENRFRYKFFSSRRILIKINLYLDGVKSFSLN